MTIMAGGGSPAEIEIGLAEPEPGPRVLAPFGRRLCRVSANEPVGRYRLVSADDPDGPTPLPGQFYMLAAAEDWGDGSSQRPYLARAFSVCRVRGNRRDFLVDDIGPGTRRLARLSPGEDLWLVGPLGIGFSSPVTLLSTEYGAGFAGHLKSGEPPAPGGLRPLAADGGSPAATESPITILVGGGIGVAPLVIWKEALLKSGVVVSVLLGFRSAMYCDAAGLLGEGVALATDDGSVGHNGLVTDLLARALERSHEHVVYACGPPRMLEAVRSVCAERSVPAQLAMEETMACGFGACYGCVIRTRDGYRRLCVDGPVVQASDLDESWSAA